jgi:hypothetical protein
MNCLSCGSQVEGLIDFGPQPSANRFLRPNDVAPKHPLIVGECSYCSLVQLINPMPASMKRNRYPWIHYVEPESFLDDLADKLVAKGFKTFRGMTYKDDSLLCRLEDRGGMVTDGWADCLIGRHCLEHRSEPGWEIENAMATNFCIEVPDSSRILEHQWFPFVWEEHVSYFTELTLKNFAACNDLTGEVFRYPMTYEDSLVAIWERTNYPAQVVKTKTLFGSMFEIQKDNWKRKTEGKAVALVGAGHLAVKFINLYEVPVSFVVDDDSNKQGLRLPGSGVEIKPTSELKRADLILSTLAPESAKRFEQKHGIRPQNIFDAV